MEQKFRIKANRKMPYKTRSYGTSPTFWIPHQLGLPHSPAASLRQSRCGVRRQHADHTEHEANHGKGLAHHQIRTEQTSQSSNRIGKTVSGRANFGAEYFDRGHPCGATAARKKHATEKVCRNLETALFFQGSRTNAHTVAMEMPPQRKDSTYVRTRPALFTSKMLKVVPAKSEGALTKMAPKSNECIPSFSFAKTRVSGPRSSLGLLESSLVLVFGVSGAVVMVTLARDLYGEKDEFYADI
jgi:hypothetical protein